MLFRSVLALLAAEALRAADPPMEATPPAYQAPWYKRWFGIGPEPPKAAPPARRNPAAEAATQRAAAQANLDRRRRVCDELRQVAFETNNNQLDEQALQLEQQAWELYKQQTAHLPCNRLLSSEDKLERQLGTAATSTTAAADQLAPARTETGRTSQANAFREVKP